jgi:hypothetical protein
VTDKLNQLRIRREELVARAAAQRGDLRDKLEPLRQPLARVDQALTVIGYVKRHPSLMVGIAVLAVILRRGPAGKWLGRGWLAWQTVQGLRSALNSPEGQNPRRDYPAKISPQPSQTEPGVPRY